MLSASIINDPGDLVLTEEGVIAREDAGPQFSQTQASQAAVYSGFVGNGLINKVFPFYYKERVRLTFSVSDRFRRDFSLIRGLIEFNRPASLVFNYDVKVKSIGIDINAGDLDRLQKFLLFVFDLFLKEKQFRHALKVAMEFESRYRLERDGIYDILRNSAATGVVG